MVKPLEEIRAAGARAEMFLSFGHGHGRQYKCNAEPRIHIVEFNPKKKGNPKHPAYRDYVVDGGYGDEETRHKTLEEAWLVLQKRDQAAADDAEWEAAAPKPKPKPCYIPGILEES